MFPPMEPTPERSRIHSEREYREWQRSLQGTVPVKRSRNEPGFLTRSVSTIRRVTARRLRPSARLRRIEQA
jgi:hypothetical protein